MRTVKFRALHYNPRTKETKWVYGDLVKNRYRYSNHTVIEGFDSENEFHCYTIRKVETIGEFTGIKDKNGKEIYEGDILSNGKGESKELIYECGRFFVEDWWEFPLDQYTPEPYVVGNIYENPELLEAEK